MKKTTQLFWAGKIFFFFLKKSLIPTKTAFI